MDEKKVVDSLQRLIREYYRTKRYDSPFRIPLAASTIGPEDVIEVLDSFLQMKLTMGQKTQKFESLWAEYIGTSGSILLNSGTSAEMLSLSVLSSPMLGSRRIRPGDEVITSPITFPSSVNSIVHAGATPVFVDINLETLNIDTDLVETAIGDRTKCVLPVHFMGNPCDMPEIMDLAHDHKLFVVEDVAESHGSEIKGKKAGSFGDIGIFSFFFSHHISTIEGGAITTNSAEYLEIGKSLRSYGWIRTLSDQRKKQLTKKYSKIDPRHLYVTVGFNFKPTEVTAALGIHQIDKIEDIISAKRSNAAYLTDKLESIPRLEEYFLLPHERKGTRHSWLGYPIVVRKNAPFDKSVVMNFLENSRIETRQLEAGNVVDQPSARHYRHKTVGTLKNSEVVMRGGLFFGLYHTMKRTDLDYIANTFEEFIAKVAK